MQIYICGVITCVIQSTMVPPALRQITLVLILAPGTRFVSTSPQKGKKLRMVLLEVGVGIVMDVGPVSIETLGLLKAIKIKLAYKTCGAGTFKAV